MLIEEDGLLFRGPALNEQREIWHYTQKKWVPYRYYDGPTDDHRAHEIGSERAEELKVNNPHAEHFLYYDTPPWSARPDPLD